MCVNIRVHRIHPVVSEENKSLRQLNTIFWGVTKWQKGLKRLTSCKAIGSVSGSNPQRVHLFLSFVFRTVSLALEHPFLGVKKSNGLMDRIHTRFIHLSKAVEMKEHLYNRPFPSLTPFHTSSWDRPGTSIALNHRTIFSRFFIQGLCIK